MIHVDAFRVGPSNYNFLLWADGSRRAVAIDPLEAEPVLQHADKNKLRIKYVVNTHGHMDHVAGNEEVAKAHGAAILVPAHEGIARASQKLYEGDRIDLDGLSLVVHDTPGHTQGHITLIVNDEYILVGDTLFLGGCGNCKFGGDVDTLYGTLQKFKDLPGHLKMLCGHEYALKNLEFGALHEPGNSAITKRRAQVQKVLDRGEMPLTTLAEEKEHNIFLRCNLERFRELRDKRNSF